MVRGRSGDVVAAEQPRPVAAGDLAEVVDCRAPAPPRLVLLAPHLGQEAPVVPTQGEEIAPSALPSRCAASMDPAIGPLRWPASRGGLGQAAARRRCRRASSGGSPFLRRTRAREAAIAASRSCSTSPEAHSGGRPSSVSALRTARAIAAHRLGLRIVAPLQRPLDGAHPAHLLLQLRLGVAVGLEDRLGRLPQIVELAELVGHLGQHPGHGLRIGCWPSEMTPRIGTGRRRAHLLAAAAAMAPRWLLQQAAGQQDLAGERIAQHPQHLVPHIRLQPIQGQDDLPLRRQPRGQSGAVGQAQRHQLLVAVQQCSVTLRSAMATPRATRS